MRCLVYRVVMYELGKTNVQSFVASPGCRRWIYTRFNDRRYALTGAIEAGDMPEIELLSCAFATAPEGIVLRSKRSLMRIMGQA